MSRLRHILVAVLFLISSQLFATHIVGGEIYYTQLDYNGNYRVTLKQFRDCFNGNPDALNGDLLSYIFVYNTDDGSLSSVLAVNADTNLNLNAPLINPCLVAPGNVCVNEAIFNIDVYLPPNSSGYDLVYQRCCRNGTIINIVNPGSVGSTIFAHVPSASLFPNNSSPRYNNAPPIFICTNDPLRFDYSATDLDGDVIRYELCDAFLGATSSCPKPDDAGSCDPGPPVYPGVPYAAGYSGLIPLNGSPAFAIDSITGLLTGTATQSGQYVVTVCAKEYRNGVLISINQREFQFNVVNCNVPIAAFPVQIEKCSGMDFIFTQNSFNATNFYWDFGDGSATTGGTVNHTYQDTGIYTVTLIATNNNPGCADTVEQLVSAYPKLVPAFSIPNAQCLDNNSADFNATGIFDQAATFSWNFGSNAIPIQASGQNVNNVSFIAPGKQTVSLTVSQFGCSKTITDTLDIYPEPRPAIIPSNNQCNGDTVLVQIVYGTNPISQVSIDPGHPTATFQNLGNTNYSFIYPDTGTFFVTLIASTASGCSDTVFEPIKVYPKFNPVFTIPPEQCLQGNQFNFSASGNFTTTATFSWYFDPSASQASAFGNTVNGITFSTDGFHDVVLQGFQYSCIDTDTQKVYVIPEPIATIDVQDQFCEGLKYDFNNLSQVSNQWFWNFGVAGVSNDTSTLKNPVFTFPDTGLYNVMLVAVNQSKCFDTTYRLISIKPIVKPFFNKPGGQCLDDNNFNLNGTGNNGSTAQFGWSFPVNASIDTAVIQNISNLTFSANGVYPITLYLSEYGCLKTYTDTAYVNEPPVAAFAIPGARGCKPVVVSFKDSSKSTVLYTYTWNFGDGNTSNQPNPTYTYNTAGVFDVSLIIQNIEGCTRKDTFLLQDAVTVLDLPKAGLSLDSIERSVFEPFINFTDLSTNAESCIIAFGDGDTSYACNVLHTYPDTGWYEYTQIVTNQFGCSDTLTGKVYIRPDFAFYIPNAFTPNGDSYNPIYKPSVFGVLEYEFSVFDRWGLEIFKTNDPKVGWDGTFKGKNAQQDVYVYKVKFLNVFREQDYISGAFTLIR